MGDVRAILAALCASAAALLLAEPAVAERIAVVTASDASSEAARYLDEQLDAPLSHRESKNARALDALRREARTEWRDDLIIVLDAERATVSVLRPADGAESSRTLAREAANEPYVAALAAVELLGIVRAMPLRKSVFVEDPASPRQPAAPPPGPVEDKPPEHPPARARWLALDLGLQQTTGANGDTSLLEPTVGVDLIAVRPTRVSWLSIGAHASGLSTMQRQQVLVLSNGVDVDPRGSVEYARNELSLRGGAAVREGEFTALATLDVGLAFKEVRAKNGAGRLLTEYSERAFWLGAGGELRYAVVGDLSFGLGVGAAWFPSTTTFRATPEGGSPVTALEESHLDVRARATLIWEAL